jgi:hypothetical protein
VLAVTGPDRLVGGPELPTASKPCLMKALWDKHLPKLAFPAELEDIFAKVDDGRKASPG